SGDIRMAHMSGKQRGLQVRLSSTVVGPLCLFVGLLSLPKLAVERTTVRIRPPARYAVVPLDPGDMCFEHLVINDRGQIAGTIRHDRGDDYRACLWRQGNLVRLPGLGSSYSKVSAINTRGQVVGTAADRAEHSHPVLWENGRVKSLGRLGRAEGEANDINDRGEIVGTLVDHYSGSPALLFRNGRRTRIRVQRG